MTKSLAAKTAALAVAAALVVPPAAMACGDAPLPGSDLTGAKTTKVVAKKKAKRRHGRVARASRS